MKAYVYGTMFREPGPGANPREGLLYCEYEEGIFQGVHYWGSAVYSRRLTNMEVKDYELIYIGEVSQ